MIDLLGWAKFGRAQTSPENLEVTSLLPALETHEGRTLRQRRLASPSTHGRSVTGYQTGVEGAKWIAASPDKDIEVRLQLTEC
eukprot:2581135-Amphidinium_carterae.5